jgi:hypothetical protein
MAAPIGDVAHVCFRGAGLLGDLAAGRLFARTSFTQPVSSAGVEATSARVVDIVYLAALELPVMVLRFAITPPTVRSVTYRSKQPMLENKVPTS